MACYSDGPSDRHNEDPQTERTTGGSTCRLPVSFGQLHGLARELAERYELDPTGVFERLHKEPPALACEVARAVQFRKGQDHDFAYRLHRYWVREDMGSE